MEMRAGTEQRGNRRYVVEHNDIMTLIEGTAGKSCELGDVSVSGARILVEDPPAVGEEAFLQCPEGGALPVKIVRRTSDGVGVEFVDPWSTAAFWYGRIRRHLRSVTEKAA